MSEKKPIAALRLSLILYTSPISLDVRISAKYTSKIDPTDTEKAILYIKLRMTIM